MILFITGGARSGKSTAAVEAARHCGRAVVFVATATAGDDEMVERIARHQNERPDEWTTVEASYALAEAITDADPEACVVVDCLSLWVAHALMTDETLSVEALDLRLDAGRCRRERATRPDDRRIQRSRFRHRPRQSARSFLPRSPRTRQPALRCSG